LAKLRQTNPALNKGKTRQYAAINNTYVLVRYSDKNSIIGLFHQGEKSTQVDLTLYSESFKGFKRMKNVFTGETFAIPEKLNLDANASAVFELIP
jgi:hypothetical protein